MNDEAADPSAENQANEGRAVDTGTEQLLCHIVDGVAVLTLNRPQARNALSEEMSPALRRMLALLADDDDVGCLVLTGAGSAFCAGGDVKGMADKGVGAQQLSFDERVAALRERQNALSGALYAFPRPVIAALPGPAAGAGFAIALACDMRFAAHSAFVTTAYAGIGLSGDYGVSWFLTRLLGSARASELLFVPERIDAQTCERLGIVNRVVADETLQDEVMALAKRIARGPRVAISYLKEHVQRAQNEDLAACMDAEAERLIRCSETSDFREATRAFVEKRSPRFTGR